MDKLAHKILGSNYKPEAIHTKRAECIEYEENNQRKQKAVVTFVFPEYHRTLTDQGHIGMSQIHEGLPEALFITVGYAIASGKLSGVISLQDCIRQMTNCIFRSEKITYRKMLKANEEAALTCETIRVRERLQKYLLVIRVEGFIEGEVECYLDLSNAPVQEPLTPPLSPQ